MKNYLTIRLGTPITLVLNDRGVAIRSVSFVPKRVHKYDPREEQIAVIGKIAVYIVHNISHPRILITL